MAGKKTADCTTARDERTKQHKPLTAKQMHFCRCVAGGMTQAAAYREAYTVREGTKHDSTHTVASRLMRDVRIRARVDELIRRRDSIVVAAAASDRQKVLQKLRDWTESAEPTDSNKIKAAELLGRSVGLFKDVVETSNGKRSASDIESDLMDRLDRLLATDSVVDEPPEDRPDSLH